MNRREFITLLGGAAAAWPLAARAQQTTKSRKVGVLHPGESTTVNMRVAAIREGLNGPDNQRDLSLDIIVRLADGDVSRLPALATDLVNNRGAGCRLNSGRGTWGLLPRSGAGATSRDHRRPRILAK